MGTHAWIFELTDEVRIVLKTDMSHMYNGALTVKYKQNIAGNNSINDFIKVYSYIVSFSKIFQL